MYVWLSQPIIRTKLDNSYFTNANKDFLTGKTWLLFVFLFFFSVVVVVVVVVVAVVVFASLNL